MHNTAKSGRRLWVSRRELVDSGHITREKGGDEGIQVRGVT